MTLGITTLCHYAEFRSVFNVKQNVIMLSVIMLNNSQYSTLMVGS